MMTTHGRIRSILAPLLALGIASSGCIMSPEPGAESIDTSELGAQTQSWCGDCPDDIDSTVIQIAPNTYYFAHSTTLDASRSVVWSKVRDIEILLDISLAGQATNFAWLNGGSAEQVPSLFEFYFGAQRLVERVTYRHEYNRILRYELAEAPVLGIEEYTGELHVDKCGWSSTLYTFQRIVTFSEDTDVEFFIDLFYDEVLTTKTYFEDNPNG